MTCRHCHVDAGPDRTAEMMSRETVDAVPRGARPHRGAHGRHHRRRARAQPALPLPRATSACARGKHVIDRCNLTILLAGPLPRPARLVRASAGSRSSARCRTTASATPTRSAATARSRSRSRRCGGSTPLGYGKGDPRLRLVLVHNPAGAFLPGDQALDGEASGSEGLAAHHGVTLRRADRAQQHADLALPRMARGLGQPRRRTWSCWSTPSTRPPWRA